GSRRWSTGTGPWIGPATSPPPAIPPTVRVASSSCTPASRSCICWACRSRPGMSNGLAMLTVSPRATLTHAPHLGAEDVDGRLHDRIRKGFLRAPAGARERQLVGDLGRGGPHLHPPRPARDHPPGPPPPVEPPPAP